MFTYPLPITDFNRSALARIRREAEALLGAPTAALSYRNFRLFEATGSRGEYENEYFEHRRRLCIFAAMALLGEDEKWTEALADIIWAICDEFTWALPAHITKQKSVPEKITRIDLFAAETALALSELYVLLDGVLPALVRERMAYELERRIVEPYVRERPRWARSNWSGVCVSGVGCTLICLKKDAAIAAVLPDLQRSVSDFLESFSEDGCCLEGSLYWSYGFSFFSYFADMLCEYTGGAVDYFKDEKVNRIAHFGQNTYLGRDDCVITFSDSPHSFKYDPGLWAILSRRYEGIAPPPPECAAQFGDDLRYRFAPFLRSLYCAPAVGNGPAGYVYYGDAQWYIHKRDGYAFAAKAGHNGEPHNHNDVGSFLLFEDGEYILDDIGFPMYYKDYFGPKRYDDMCASSLGHSVPHLDGAGQKAGAEHRGTVLAAEADHFAIEFADAYGTPALNTLRRTFDLDADGITVRDIAVGDAPITERFVTQIEPQITGTDVRIGRWTLRCAEAKDVCISTFTYYTRFAEFDEAESAPRTVWCIDFDLGGGREAAVRVSRG